MSDLDILTELDFSTEALEELKKNTPCDNDPIHCKSHHTEKASWLVTHQTSDGSCTRIICDPCCVDVQKWIARCVVRGGEFHCVKCHVDFNYKTFIFREI